MRLSEDCWERRIYCFKGFEQHLVILRTVWSAECIVFYRLWATLSHLTLPSEDCWECRCYCFFYMLWATCNLLSPSGDNSECISYWYLQVWGNIESSSISVWGLLGARPFTEELHTTYSNRRLPGAVLWAPCIMPCIIPVHNIFSRVHNPCIIFWSIPFPVPGRQGQPISGRSPVHNAMHNPRA